MAQIGLLARRQGEGAEYWAKRGLMFARGGQRCALQIEPFCTEGAFDTFRRGIQRAKGLAEPARGDEQARPAILEGLIAGVRADREAYDQER